MSQRGQGTDADDTQTQGEHGLLHVDSPSESVPFDTFPPATASPTGVTDVASGRFGDGARAGSDGEFAPGSRRAQRRAQEGAETVSNEPASFRVRDFRPPEESVVSPASPSPASGTPAPSAAVTPPAGRPLTRRELRALEAERAREAAEAESGGASEQGQAFGLTSAETSPVSAPRIEPPPLVEPPRVDLVPPTYVPSSLDLPGRPTVDAPSSQQQPVAPEQAPSAPAPSAPESSTLAPSTPTSAAPEYSTAAPAAPESSTPEPSAQVPTEQPPRAPSLYDLEPPMGAPLGTSPTEIPTLADFPPPPAPPVPPAPPAPPQPPVTSEGFVPQYSLAQYPPPTMLPDSVESARGIDFTPHGQTPLGHWSTQEAIDDASQTTGPVTSRDVTTSSGPITSSALVLPAIPEGSDLSVPFSTATGEVLITGSISLPPTLGTTGAHPARYDHSDLDAIIDAVDRDDVEGDSAPVRAIRAVSTHTSPRDVISVSRNSGGGNRLPIVLAITAGTMMVSVTVLVVVGIMVGTL